MSLTRLRWKDNVFHRLPYSTDPVRRALTWFSRGVAIKYFLYTAWAASSLIEGIPAVVQAQGEGWQLIFSSVTMILTGFAFFGASFFPKTGKMELRATAGFTGLVGYYFFLLFQQVLAGEAEVRSMLIIGTLLVVPICRMCMIMYTIRHKEPQNETSGGEQVQG